MMLAPVSALTFQLGIKVAAMAPKTPSKASRKAKICSPAEAMGIICGHRLPAQSSLMETQAPAVADCFQGKEVCEEQDESGGEGGREREDENKESENEDEQIESKIRATVAKRASKRTPQINAKWRTTAEHRAAHWRLGFFSFNFAFTNEFPKPIFIEMGYM